MTLPELRLDVILDPDEAESRVTVWLNVETPGDGICLGLGPTLAAACDDAADALLQALQAVYERRLTAQPTEGAPS